jgi:hypothetical protein
LNPAQRGGLTVVRSPRMEHADRVWVGLSLTAQGGVMRLHQYNAVFGWIVFEPMPWEDVLATLWTMRQLVQRARPGFYPRTTFWLELQLVG